MTAIFKRELKAFFCSPVGYIFVAALMFLNGIYFMSINLLSGYSKVSYTVSSSLILFVFVLPFLAMRVMSEEKKLKTDQLTLTSPVRVAGIVVGKYLAMAVVLLIPILVICLFPLIMSMYGQVPFAESYVSILGFFLYGLAGMALTLLISSLTENQIVAAVLGVAAMFVTYIMDGITQMLSQVDNVVTKVICAIFTVFDFGSRLTHLLEGVLDLKSIAYYLTFIVICLFLTTQVIEKRRYTVSVKNIKLGAFSTGLIVVVIAAGYFANFGLSKVPADYTEFDFTNNKLYTLSEDSKLFVNSLQDDIEIYVIANEDEMDDMVVKTLKNYEKESDHIKVSYKDPTTDPMFYKQYSEEEVNIGSLIVVSDKRSKVIDVNDLYEMGIDYTTYQQMATGYDGEGRITSAINYCVMDEITKGYAIGGHNEGTIGSDFAAALTKMNVTMEDLALISVDKVPDDAAFVLILAPETDFSKDDATKLIDYVKGGGNILVSSSMIENPAQNQPNLQTVLDLFGAQFKDGVIIEGDSGYYYSQPTYLLPEVENTLFTDNIYNQSYIFLPYAQAVSVKESDDVDTTTILTSSEDSYIKTGDGSDISYADGDETGPFDIAVYARTFFGEKEARAFFFGSYNLFSNDANEMVSGANARLFGNCVSEFSDSEMGAVAIAVKPYETERLIIDTAMGMFLGVLIAFIIPVVLIISGIIVWNVRRKL